MEQNNIILYVPINKVLRRINQKWDIIIYIIPYTQYQRQYSRRAAGCNSSLPLRLQQKHLYTITLYIIIRKRAEEAASVRDRRDIAIVFLLLSRV